MNYAYVNARQVVPALNVCVKKTACYVQKCVYVLTVAMTKMIMIMLTPMLKLTKSNIRII